MAGGTYFIYGTFSVGFGFGGPNICDAAVASFGFLLSIVRLLNIDVLFYEAESGLVVWSFFDYYSFFVIYWGLIPPNKDDSAVFVEGNENNWALTVVASETAGFFYSIASGFFKLNPPKADPSDVVYLSAVEVGTVIVWLRGLISIFLGATSAYFLFPSPPANIEPIVGFALT